MMPRWSSKARGYVHDGQPSSDEELESSSPQAEGLVATSQESFKAHGEVEASGPEPKAHNSATAKTAPVVNQVDEVDYTTRLKMPLAASKCTILMNHPSSKKGMLSSGCSFKANSKVIAASELSLPVQKS